MIWALLLVPAIAGLIALVIRPNWPRRALLLLAAVVHTTLVAACWVQLPRRQSTVGWPSTPRPLLFLSITSVLFLAADGLCRGLSCARKPGSENTTMTAKKCRS